MFGPLSGAQVKLRFERNDSFDRDLPLPAAPATSDAQGELIARAVPEVVVDVLEMIDVDEKQCADCAVRERCFKTLLQTVTVRKIRQGVV